MLGIELMSEAPQESVRELERAAELAQDDPRVLFRVASALYGAGAPGPAARSARRVAELADETFVFGPDLLQLAGLLALRG